jgi:hypothetical protein
MFRRKYIERKLIWLKHVAAKLNEIVKNYWNRVAWTETPHPDLIHATGCRHPRLRSSIRLNSIYCSTHTDSKYWLCKQLPLLGNSRKQQRNGFLWSVRKMATWSHKRDVERGDFYAVRAKGQLPLEDESRINSLESSDNSKTNRRLVWKGLQPGSSAARRQFYWADAAGQETATENATPWRWGIHGARSCHQTTGENTTNYEGLKRALLSSRVSELLIAL